MFSGTLLSGWKSLGECMQDWGILEAVTVELKLNFEGELLCLTADSVQYLSSINPLQIIPFGLLGTTKTNF